MGRYFFDVFDGGRSWYRDDAGAHLSASEVEDQAIALLPDVARDVLLRHAFHRLEIAVRDRDGKFVYSASLTFNDRHASPEDTA